MYDSQGGEVEWLSALNWSTVGGRLCCRQAQTMQFSKILSMRQQREYGILFFKKITIFRIPINFD